MIPRWAKPDYTNVAVASGETNTFFQAGNLSFEVFPKIRTSQ
jgi:hypothetical protein